MSQWYTNVCSRKWMEIAPEVLASTVAASLHLVMGQIIAYSGVIIPQMMREQNGTNNVDAIPITESDSAWIASAPVFSGLAVSIFAGVLIDVVGRLKTIMFASVPGVIGFLLIATASNMSMIIWGRIIIGVTHTFVANSVAIYISEISRPDIRGSLLALKMVFTSLGIVSIFLKGWVMHWRAISWINIAYLLIPIIAVYFTPESPAWLIAKSRIVEAKKSLTWFRKYSLKSVEQELLELQDIHNINEKFNWYQQLRMFFLPTFYKPFLILVAIFFFQQFSGTFVIIYNCVIFFEDIGTKINPYVASISISGVKVVMSFISVMLMKKFRRRALLMVSAGGMAITLSISGLYTPWLQQGVSTQTWVPLVCLMFYVLFSSMGLMTMPFMIAGEMFPLRIRGMAYSLLITIVNLFTFSALQSYFPLNHLLGGSAGLQYFYAIMSVAAMIIVYLFLPETHKHKLIDIENHFWNHTIYLPVRKEKRKTKTELHSVMEGK